jgi:hypothetical protein
MGAMGGMGTASFGTRGNRHGGYASGSAVDAKKGSAERGNPDKSGRVSQAAYGSVEAGTRAAGFSDTLKAAGGDVQHNALTLNSSQLLDLRILNTLVLNQDCEDPDECDCYDYEEDEYRECDDVYNAKPKGQERDQQGRYSGTRSVVETPFTPQSLEAGMTPDELETAQKDEEERRMGHKVDNFVSEWDPTGYLANAKGDGPTDPDAPAQLAGSQKAKDGRDKSVIKHREGEYLDTDSHSAASLDKWAGQVKPDPSGTPEATCAGDEGEGEDDAGKKQTKKGKPAMNAFPPQAAQPQQMGPKGPPQPPQQQPHMPPQQPQQPQQAPQAGGMQPGGFPNPMQGMKASQKAAMASVIAGGDARGAALEAIDQAQKGKGKQASKKHADAADAHDKDAAAAMQQGNQQLAQQHAQAAMAHRQAAGLHQGGPMMGGQGGPPQQMAGGGAMPQGGAQQGPPTKNTSAPLSTTTRKGETIMMVTRQQLVDKLAVNCACAEDKAALNRLSDQTLLKLAANTEDESGSGSDSIQAGGEEDDEDSDDQGKTKKSKDSIKDSGQGPTAKGTQNRYLSSEDNETLAEARRIVHAQKVQIVNRLLAANTTLSPERKKAHGQRLIKLTLNQLREQAELIPAPVENYQYTPTESETVPLYMGAAGGPIFNQSSDDDNEKNVLTMPTINYAELANLPKKGRSARTG